MGKTLKRTKYPEFFTRNDYKPETPEEREKKIEALLRALTIEEKCSLLGGAKEPESKGKVGNAGYQRGVPRLGIPEAVMYDGPAGVTGVCETTGLPQPSLLGCTWDEEMAYRFGKVAATENAACSGNYQLAPQVDIIRSPHFGRNKDMKAEDPYLNSRMAVAETKGIQDNHVVATIKHFAVANTMGHGPGDFKTNTVIDEQTLHECYLKSFEEAIIKGNAGSVMNAYNKINGKFATANRYLNVEVLRNMWNFKGSLMSDWGAVHEFTLNKGMDMEMPYPAYNDQHRVLKNIRNGKMDWDALDEACRHVLYGMAEAGLLGLVALDEDGDVMQDPDHTEPIQMEWYYEEAVESGLLEENAKTAAEIVRKGIVLMKNEREALPLNETELNKKVALIGLGAKYPVCGEAQERSFGRLERMVSPAQALSEQTGKEFVVEPGIDYVGEVIPGSCLFVDENCTQPGIRRTYGILPEDRNLTAVQGGPGGGGAAFQGGAFVDEDGEEVNTGIGPHDSSGEHYSEGYPLGQIAGIDDCINLTCGTDENGNIVKNYRNGINGNALVNGDACTWKGYLKAPETGEYSLYLECIGGEGRFYIKIENEWIQAGSSNIREWTQWPWAMLVNTPEGMGISGKKIQLEKDQVYPICVYGRAGVKYKDLQIRAAWSTPAFKADNYQRAMKAVAEADTVVFFLTDSNDAENMSERFFKDHRDIDVSKEQQEFLLDAVAHRKENGKFIVVLQTSNARAIGKWADKVDAIVNTYMPGQEGSRVIAEVLTGRTNPSGKLNQTWPKSREDTPITDTEEHYYQREEGCVVDGCVMNRMSEGIFFGYRWYDKYGVEPQFPFGHGLSYTRFEYSDLDIHPIGGEFEITFRITNVGKMKGDEVAQVYLGSADVPAYVQMAQKQLVGYARVKNIMPGECRNVSIIVEGRMLCYWDTALPLKERENGTRDKWFRAAGTRKVYVGASSRDIRLESEIAVSGEGEYL